MTSSLGRNARACMVCSLVQPYNVSLTSVFPSLRPIYSPLLLTRLDSTGLLQTRLPQLRIYSHLEKLPRRHIRMYLAGL